MPILTPSALSPLPTPLPRCRINSGQQAGVVVWGAGTKGRIEGCNVAANKGAGVEVKEDGDPSLAGNTICDHAGGAALESAGCGIWVRADARGRATAVDCFFARNTKGDVVRE